METPVLNQFLREISSLIQQKNGVRLQDVLQLEPPLPEAYGKMVAELNTVFPKNNDQGLISQCEQIVPPAEDGLGSSWSAFPDFLARYFRFLRDADPTNLADLYEKLKSLTNQSIIALSDTTNGVTILQTVLYLSKVLAKVAVGLDKNPELVSNVNRGANFGDSDGATEKVTFVERSANVLREAFIKCLTDKSGTGGLTGAGRKGKPLNKRTGIYMTANSCLKLLFQCRKLRNAQQIFSSIDAQSPLLSHYPAAQRVTYLYYLGRYLFANNHFHRAQLALTAAYEQCHRDAVRQRELILTYLIPANICLGRFPHSKLLMRRDASGIGKRFLRLCRSIAQGDFAAFRHQLSIYSDDGQWFLKKRILLQLQSRCEMLVWRSLVRKVFNFAGYLPQGDDNRMPFLHLTHLVTAAQLCRQRDAVFRQSGMFNGHTALGQASEENEYVDQEFEGLEEAIAETGFDPETGTYHEYTEQQHESAHQAKVENSSDTNSDEISLEEVESILSSLIQQRLLRGFVTHNTPRFAIPGSKSGGGAIKTGFPNIWLTLTSGASDEVPGWVQESRLSDAASGSGGGRVVNLSGARPVGPPS